MSPSKSVARSVRISSGAKSVTNQEYISSLKKALHCQLYLFGITGLYCTIFCYQIKMFPRLFTISMRRITDGSDIKISLSHILFLYHIS